jgi:hypothetical protein
MRTESVRGRRPRPFRSGKFLIRLSLCPSLSLSVSLSLSLSLALSFSLSLSRLSVAIRYRGGLGVNVVRLALELHEQLVELQRFTMTSFLSVSRTRTM